MMLRGTKYGEWVESRWCGRSESSQLRNGDSAGGGRGIDDGIQGTKRRGHVLLILRFLCCWCEWLQQRMRNGHVLSWSRGKRGRMSHRNSRWRCEQWNHLDYLLLGLGGNKTHEQLNIGNAIGIHGESKAVVFVTSPAMLSRRRPI